MQTLESLTHDLRCAFRALATNGRFTALVAITLALTIGASTAVFSVANAFGADPNVIGSSVTLDGVPYAVAAVMPQGFEFPIRAASRVDLWLPLERFNPALAERRNARLMDVIGRLRPGASLAQAQADSDQPIDNIGTLEQRLAGTLAVDRFRALLLGSFSAVALMLAAVGLFAVLSYTTARRMREIGIRMALGARAADVAKTVVGQGMRPVVGGVLIGAAGAAILFRLVDNLLFEVAATDGTAFGVAIAVLLSVAALACAVPARRAARADAVSILKSE